ncbi:MAG TPA: DUF4157 domain-containing protein [Longimicrobium sp.]|nr:DUF4157 domain-containing protein [Longimicrobium sp.]
MHQREPAPRAPEAPTRPPAERVAPRPAAPVLARQLGNQGFGGLAAARLQRCSCGGSCPSCSAKKEEPPPLQAKLTVGAAGDAYEREADQVAEQVMRMPAPGSVESTAAPSVQRQGDEEESELQAQPLVAGITPLPPGGVQRAGDDDDERELVQAKSADGDPHAGREAPAEASEILRSPGEPLDAGTRSFIEPRFGAGFEGVRVHTGASADVAARSVGARAYTVGNHVVFGAGEYTPGNDAGKRLLAHELTHVVQQGGAAEPPETARRTPVGPRVQREKKKAAGPCAGGTKTVTVDLVKMDGATRTPADDLAEVNKIFAPCCVKFTAGSSHTATAAQTTAWIGDQDVKVAPGCGDIEAEEKSLYDNAIKDLKLTSRIRAYFVNSISGVSAYGYSIGGYCAKGAAAGYGNNMIIENDALSDSMAHEFGHILINSGTHAGIDDPSDKNNLMFAPGRTGSKLDASQCAAIFGNA